MPASANALSGDSGEIVLDDVPVSSSNENDVEAALKNMCVGEKDEDDLEGDENCDSVDVAGSESESPCSPGVNGEKQRKGLLGRGLSWIGKKAKKVVGGKDTSGDLHKELLVKLQACRHADAAAKGGLRNLDYEGISKSRSVLAEVVKQVGQKILKGQNLMSVSFPVRCCQPRTILECAAYQFVFCPHYLTAAANASEPVERMKFVTCAFIACIHTTSQFVKPFNPTLGETLEAEFGGGVSLFVEQTSHHPPVTSWLLQGPNFKYYGWSTYTASFGYNKLYVNQSGMRRCEFDDGTTIDVTFSQDKYNSVLWGEVVHEILGTYKFTDEKNKLVCTVEMNPSKALPSDAFVGTLERLDKSGEAVETASALQGSFLGFLDFDGQRYWSIHSSRERVDPVFRAEHLPSDSRTRADRNALVAGDEERAQVEKVCIEERQRRERRLREAVAKAKESGVS